MQDPLMICGLKTCDSTRKALSDMQNSGLTPVFRDLRTDPLTAPEIAEILVQFGDRAINRASATWRGLTESDRALPVETLMSRFPALIKRPLIRAPSGWYQGWTPSTRAVLLG